MPKILTEIHAKDKSPLPLFQAVWPKVIGVKLAAMTEVIAFENGVLTISVSNASLYSLLAQYEKGRILKKIKGQFPEIEIHDIYFRRGV